MQIYGNFPGIQEEISEHLVNVTTEHMNMEMRIFRRIYSIKGRGYLGWLNYRRSNCYTTRRNVYYNLNSTYFPYLTGIYDNYYRNKPTAIKLIVIQASKCAVSCHDRLGFVKYPPYLKG